MAGLVVRLAETREDLLKAAELVYNRYLAEGYIQPNRYTLWMTHFQLYEDALTVLGEVEGRVLATVTLTFSDRHPLPSAFVFPEEVQALQGKKAEATCLASAGTWDVVLKVMAYAWKVVMSQGADWWIISVNPKRERQFGWLGFEVLARRDDFLYMDVPVVLMATQPAALPRRLHPRLRNYVVSSSAA